MSTPRQIRRAAWRSQYAPGMFKRRDRVNGWRLFAGRPLLRTTKSKLAIAFSL